MDLKNHYQLAYIWGKRGEGRYGALKLSVVKDQKWSQTSYYNSPQCLIDDGNVPCLIQLNLNLFRRNFRSHMPLQQTKMKMKELGQTYVSSHLRQLLKTRKKCQLVSGVFAQESKWYFKQTYLLFQLLDYLRNFSLYVYPRVARNTFFFF